MCGRIHCCISAVLVCISIALAGAVIAGFLVQKYEISKLQQRSIAHDNALYNRTDELELKLSHTVKHRMQYNSTITSYDDQELHDKLEELRVLSTNISEQINHLHLVRNDHSDQLSQVNLRLTNLQTQINDIDWRLREVERKSSAAAFYRMNSTMIMALSLVIIIFMLF